MVKKSKSKNSIIKKAKKLQRQSKHKKALALCDEYLATDLDLNILEIKIDILNILYFSDEFLDKLSIYQNTLNNFLSKSEKENLLKIYSATKNKMDFYTQSYDNSYLIGGLLLDNLESILILDEITSNNQESSSEIPKDLNDFKENTEKTAKQYLSLNGGNVDKILNDEVANLDKTKLDIKELTKFIVNKKNQDEDLDQEKTPQENENDEKNIAKLLNKAIKHIDNEDYEEALDFINHALSINGKEINLLEYKVLVLNKLGRFEEGLNTQKKLVKIAKNLDIDNSKITKEKSIQNNSQTSLSDF